MNLKSQMSHHRSQFQNEKAQSNQPPSVQVRPTAPGRKALPFVPTTHLVNMVDEVLSNLSGDKEVYASQDLLQTFQEFMEELDDVLQDLLLLLRRRQRLHIDSTCHHYHSTTLLLQLSCRTPQDIIDMGPTDQDSTLQLQKLLP